MRMVRDIYKILCNWKSHPLRMPLILRGARQVGKTYAVEDFGKLEFESTLTLNFESDPKYKECFEDLDLLSTIRSIELISRQKVIPGKVLLFLDEIQSCPKALQSLRYFKEKIPELHVIAAGSLLEFAIEEENFSFPVGRVQFARLYPLSFGEFLDASGNETLRKELETFQKGTPPSSAVHHHLLQKVREYFVVGGMPAAITAFLLTNSFLDVKHAQKAIWDAYENDFGKYATKTQHRYLRKIFQEVPRLIGNHVKYSKIDPELPNPIREMKRAMELLKLAGLIHPVLATSAGGVPLLAGLKETIFKLLFLDIGLVEQSMDVDPGHPRLMTGALAEQFVGQELLAGADPLLGTQLFFWNRDHGSAEVDYLISLKGSIIPIEVKAGKEGTLKSLYLFLKEKQAPFGVRISEAPLSLKNGVLSIPCYLISEMDRSILELNQNFLKDDDT